MDRSASIVVPNEVVPAVVEVEEEQGRTKHLPPHRQIAVKMPRRRIRTPAMLVSLRQCLALASHCPECPCSRLVSCLVADSSRIRPRRRHRSHLPRAKGVKLQFDHFFLHLSYYIKSAFQSYIENAGGTMRHFLLNATSAIPVIFSRLKGVEAMCGTEREFCLLFSPFCSTWNLCLSCPVFGTL